MLGLFQEFQLVSRPFARVQSPFLLLAFLVPPSTATAATTDIRPVVLLGQVLGVVPRVVLIVFLALVSVLYVGFGLVGS